MKNNVVTNCFNKKKIYEKIFFDFNNDINKFKNSKIGEPFNLTEINYLNCEINT